MGRLPILYEDIIVSLLVTVGLCHCKSDEADTVGKGDSSSKDKNLGTSSIIEKVFGSRMETSLCLVEEIGWNEKDRNVDGSSLMS